MTWQRQTFPYSKEQTTERIRYSALITEEKREQIEFNSIFLLFSVIFGAKQVE
jgi:hypothetical protein